MTSLSVDKKSSPERSVSTNPHSWKSVPAHGALMSQLFHLTWMHSETVLFLMVVEGSEWNEW
jgi:hypothetical protein